MDMTVVLFIINALLGMILLLVGFVVKRMVKEMDQMRTSFDELNKELPKTYSQKSDMQYMIDQLVSKFDKYELRLEKLIDKIDELKKNQ